MDEARSHALRALLRTLAIAAPLALLGFLLLGDFFGGYSGLAVGWREVPGGTVDAATQRIVLEDGDNWQEVILPAQAFAGRKLPRLGEGVPPERPPEGAVQVEKRPFSLLFKVGSREWPTFSVVDLLVPLVVLALVAGVWNGFHAGSPFRLVIDPNAPPPKRTIGKMGGLGTPAAQPREPPPPNATPSRPKFGPPQGPGLSNRAQRRREKKKG